MEKEEMTNNTEEKSLTVIKDKNIFTKVIEFFKNIFNKKEQTNQNTEQNHYNNQTNRQYSFATIDNIEIKFQKFRQGAIKEEELTEQEKQKMIKIFQEKIANEQSEINNLKNRILYVRAEYLKMRKSNN